ncbi:MAG: phosphopantetheine-binding protein, partial [Gammaproteobacteria bacterium]|nr:phosphopantetheine-binding protein [Gammaproteobacteria bacterium]
LGLERVGIHDNFFDIGGNSVLVLSLLNIINAKLNAKVQVTDIFQYPSVSKMTKYLAPHETNLIEEKPRVNNLARRRKTLSKTSRMEA